MKKKNQAKLLITWDFDDPRGAEDFARFIRVLYDNGFQKAVIEIVKAIAKEAECRHIPFKVPVELLSRVNSL